VYTSGLLGWDLQSQRAALSLCQQSTYVANPTVRKLENSGILLIGIAAGRARGVLSEPTPRQSVDGKSSVRLCVILLSGFFFGLENNLII
jgi:hypothetical protein